MLHSQITVLLKYEFHGRLDKMSVMCDLDGHTQQAVYQSNLELLFWGSHLIMPAFFDWRCLLVAGGQTVCLWLSSGSLRFASQCGR